MRYSVLLLAGALSKVYAQDPAQTEYFEKRVRPILVSRCQPCHNSKIKTAGLDLETAAGFLKGGASGLLVTKEKLEDSRLLHVISYDDRIKMPPTGKLKPDELSALTEWVKAGGVWAGPIGSAEVSTPAASASGVRNWAGGISPEDRKFWAFQAVRDPQIPKVKDNKWTRNPIDHFILAKLEAKSLEPAGPASKTALLRRATYDLTGLPPTETELDAFLADQSPNAFEKVVDRLLASPRYGEKWGRNWLDVARYADSTGNDEDHRYPYAWRYRDYVIDAFNGDLPYDQFVREQIAGDLMPSADGGPVNKRGLVATGFLALGPKALAQPDKRKMIVDVWDEQIDVTSRAFLGLTIACARCHDHKFDPIETKDYYSLMGIFASTDNFQDPKSNVAKLLYVPLVEKGIYEQYKSGQAQLDRKRAEREILEEDRHLDLSQQYAPHVAEYMLAAWRIRQQKGAAAAEAKASNLDPRVLEKWVKLLEPEGAPPHFDAWMHSKPEQLGIVAAQYQKQYVDQLDNWSKQVAKWREKAAKAIANKTNAPGKPNLDPEKAPFFHAVQFEEGPFAVQSADFKSVYDAEFAARIEGMRKEETELKKSLPEEPAMACAVRDGTPVEQKVFIRGDYSSEGDAAPKVFPAVLRRSDDPVVEKGSGRLELANWIASPRNPMTARVMVNRVWLGHFGEGLVRTADNWGKMGERPTHPELLDWLAARFVESGWSIKKMHKLIMLSSAYQMSSGGLKESIGDDPENRLLAHFSRRRLSVEEIRDAMLAIDGSIDYEMGGTLQKGFGTDGENSNGRLSLNPEKMKRRMVYLPLRRSNLPSLLNLFDFGDAVTPMGKRVLTNVAPQALFAMNSGFVQERAATITKHVMEQSADPRTRVTEAYRLILNRAPDAGEVDTLLTYLARFQQKFPERNEVVAWQSISHILLASSEFVYLD